jgi:hypothetical protein
MNVDLDVPAGQVGDFAIHFDASKCFVETGNAGKHLFKPMPSVIPILSSAGQRIVGFVDPSLVTSGATISERPGGTAVRATPPDATCRFELYPVLPGPHGVVITASGRVSAVMTGVLVAKSTSSVIGGDAARLNTSISASTTTASVVVAFGGDLAETGAWVRVIQRCGNGAARAGPMEGPAARALPFRQGHAAPATHLPRPGDQRRPTMSATATTTC